MRIIYFCKKCGFTGSDEASMRNNPANCPRCDLPLLATDMPLSTWKEFTPENKEAQKKIWARDLSKSDTAIFSIDGCRGRSIIVYPEKCIIQVRTTVGSVITGNATDGDKTIYYTDVIGLQTKDPGFTLGYIQLETAASTANNTSSNFFNENTFTYEKENIQIQNMIRYITNKLDSIKKAQAASLMTGGVSPADELRKYKELLDMGALTQEEFDAKKKQLLAL